MLKRNICASFVIASTVVVGAGRAQANDATSLIGGAILGGIIVNEVNKNKQRQQQQQQQLLQQQRNTTVQRSSVSSSQREANRQVQQALNYFGYNVGTADGVLGSNSRSGIRRYQADMGYSVDGYLDPHERDFLLNSHQRAMAGGNVAPYNQIVATQGYAGLLRTYRNEQLGIATPGTQTAASAVPMPVPAPTQPEPVSTRADTASTALPTFGVSAAQKSMRDQCDQVNVRTAANGGLSAPGKITDPAFALNEQFCLARMQAMSDTTRIEATIPNMSQGQIETQCDGLAQAIAPQIVAIDSAPAAQVIDATRAFLDASGQPLDQLVASGKVCLGAGYRADNAEMALASAVLLSAAGQGGYAEMVSHQLRDGFGAQVASPQVAASWMQVALSSSPVLGQTPERLAVLKATSGGIVPVFPTASGN
ncbi:peptidoglycan-binding domain-containing protein [Pseudodonghicola xiamenensis]|uniref:Peptidoglycan-binding protein n=1 Tax=Pseudodonghicola xiamenensis TaxID=337702 RepID=A0A8J3H8Z6_9RHOB|nr:peptidoglycan-binding domain-containing protein [Pseudodonghicola xiamenensis]GHG91366.1 peptidoglycan-binding protein [Pseudodonghicola xiamenensis]